MDENIEKRKQMTISLLANIIQQLHDHGIPELDPSMPIVDIEEPASYESSHLDTLAEQYGIEGHHGFLGFTRLTQEGWTDPTQSLSGHSPHGKVSIPLGTRRYSITHHAKYVAVRMRRKPEHESRGSVEESTNDGAKDKNDPNIYYELERLIPTFLHELTHCITRRCQIWNVDTQGSKSTTKGGRTAAAAVNIKHLTWVPDDHNPEFYEQFARILRAAEGLEIFKLPQGTANKFSMRSLLRFDALDCAVVPLSMIGSTKLSIDDVHSQINDCPIPNVTRASTNERTILSYQVLCMHKGVTKPVRFSVERVLPFDAALPTVSSSAIVLEKLIQTSAPKFRLKPGQIKKLLNRQGLEISTDAEFDRLLADEGHRDGGGSVMFSLVTTTGGDTKEKKG